MPTPNPKRRLRLIVAATVVLCAAGAAAYATLKNEAPKSDDKAAAPIPPTLSFAPSDIAVVDVRALERTLSISGSLNPVTQALIKSRVSGEVLRLAVREGETVARGQILVEIDATDLRNRLEAAQADLEERRARLMIATRNRETNEALLKRNFIAQSAFDQTQSTWQAGEAAVRWGEAQVRLARTALDEAVVRSPISGIVAKRLVNQGERVAPESPLLNVVDLTRLELEATVPASDMPDIGVGQAVMFAVDGFGARSFSGRVGRINPVTEAGSRAVKLFIDVPNSDQALKGGMFAQGGLVLSRSTAGPVIPASAAFEEAGQRYVFAIAGGKLDKRAVVLSQSEPVGGLLAVQSGLAGGDTVVRIRMNGLKAGAPATIKPAAEAAKTS